MQYLCLRFKMIDSFIGENVESLNLYKKNLTIRISDYPPTVLLDDKLDDTRVTQLVQLVTQKYFRQFFITNVDLQRTEAVIKSIRLTYEITQIDKRSKLVWAGKSVKSFMFVIYKTKRMTKYFVGN